MILCISLYFASHFKMYFHIFIKEINYVFGISVFLEVWVFLYHIVLTILKDYMKQIVQCWYCCFALMLQLLYFYYYFIIVKCFYVPVTMKMWDNNSEQDPLESSCFNIWSEPSVSHFQIHSYNVKVGLKAFIIKLFHQFTNYNMGTGGCQVPLFPIVCIPC